MELAAPTTLGLAALTSGSARWVVARLLKELCGVWAEVSCRGNGFSKQRSFLKSALFKKFQKGVCYYQNYGKCRALSD
jgi:hypothetical protein